jgi:hypothetical protein
MLHALILRRRIAGRAGHLSNQPSAISHTPTAHRRYSALISAVHGYQDDGWTLITLSGVWYHVSTVFWHASLSASLKGVALCVNQASLMRKLTAA